MNHFNPHPSAAFEGYYSKFRLPSGASIALIISAVYTSEQKIKSKATPLDGGNRVAEARPYMASFTYVAVDSKSHWQREYWLQNYDVQKTHSAGGGGFCIRFEQGEFSWEPASPNGTAADKVYWRLDTEDIRFETTTTHYSSEADAFENETSNGRIPWQPRNPSSTPAGALADFPLPIQWHVHSVDSRCQFSLEIYNYTASPDVADGVRTKNFTQVPALDRSGAANVHIEKNWALTFPPSYIWIQARNHDTHKGITLAGGALFTGVQAFLVGYHGALLPSRNRRFISFGPPTSTSIFGWSLGMLSNISFATRSASVDITGWFMRLQITATAEEDTFFTLAAPLAKGHVADYATQSFAARVRVVCSQRRWPWEGWREVEKEEFEGASLEFGGDFYRSHTD